MVTIHSCDAKEGTKGRSPMNTTSRITPEVSITIAGGWLVSRASEHGCWGKDRKADLCGFLLENTSLFSSFNTKH